MFHKGLAVALLQLRLQWTRIMFGLSLFVALASLFLAGHCLQDTDWLAYNHLLSVSCVMAI